MGARLAAGSTPVPLRLTTCGFPAASSLMVMTPALAPVAAGAKVTLMVQLAAGASVLRQVCVSGKMAGRLELMPLIFIKPVPLLVSVTVCAALVVWTR